MIISNEKFNAIAISLTVISIVFIIYLGFTQFKRLNDDFRIKLRETAIQTKETEHKIVHTKDSLNWVREKAYLDNGFSKKYPVDINQPYWYK